MSVWYVWAGSSSVCVCVWTADADCGHWIQMFAIFPCRFLFSFRFSHFQCIRNWLVNFLQSISWNVAHNISLLIVAALDTNNVVFHTENSNYNRNDKWNLANLYSAAKTDERCREREKENWSTCRPANKIKCIKNKKTTWNEMNESKISSVRKNLISSVRLCLMSKRTAYTIISFNWITFWACDFRLSMRRETCAATTTATTLLWLSAYANEMKGK